LFLNPEKEAEWLTEDNRFAEITLEETFRDKVHIFDKMGSKRHRVIYDVSGLISKGEAEHTFDFA
jgi:hypothetical protein